MGLNVRFSPHIFRLEPSPRVAALKAPVLLHVEGLTVSFDLCATPINALSHLCVVLGRAAPVPMPHARPCAAWLVRCHLRTCLARRATKAPLCASPCTGMPAPRAPHHAGVPAHRATGRAGVAV
ncbi:hypothetical protein HAX54_042791 [Datura stramonium]|uniref:Uncharacterized protein n=1 Tax=Datura stramonium TaxID=4076 RepID=A0ABS8SM90_DATST|nr:hypothetical protein [Datura stramonium]